MDRTREGKEIIEIDLQDIIRKLFKHRATLINTVFIAAAASLVYSFTTIPVYRATSRVMVERRAPKIVKVDDMIIPDQTDQTNFFNSQVEILKSQTLANLVFQELGTYEPASRRGKSADQLKPITKSERLEALLEQIIIFPVRMTQIIDVSADDPDPQLAARIANTWTQAYIFLSSVDQLIQRRSELEIDMYQRSKYLKGKNPVILGLQSEIEAIDEKIQSERSRLTLVSNQSPENTTWGGNTSNVKIIDMATVPVNPVRPRKAFNLALAIVFGIFFGGALAFLFESLDHTIKTAFDLEQTIKMSCLVAIPAFNNKNAPKDLIPEFISEKIRSSLVAESFRHLRTNIVYSNPDFPSRTIMVTSSSTLEGKTTTAINLACVFAQAGERTIVIDTDMRSPRLQAVFRTERIEGLSDVLISEKGDVRPFIQKTDIPNLDIITCGKIPPNPSELLVSKKMEDVITKLSKDYDRVILDTPPVLAVTDAVILSTKVQAIIFVARSGFTHRQAVLSSIKTLKSVNARILAVVLNMVDFYGHGDHYGYSLYDPNTRAKIAAKTKAKGFFKNF
ncbi:MAG: polysaccharide biosynthesis tyrosine autokinase [Candidatus Omnitrophota bacterium]